ncbi:thiosulfate sulfurtransferase [Leifsonia xyli subsp. cynodontis DSM 46306]|uniref:Rhodanese domain-containing protein n=1 Tax=Leifsonia xyli subsp. cynodontis DSM 46306 TaxID=1389489 RepID=U3P8J2_LEIXC|nr:rhodanese-like domain-containing protein [Leifsonia xyli]AGW41252.1 thiosulfate sulfurtransferase [Leifsonia xyli subsp. cynodontis DSM 46306]
MAGYDLSETEVSATRARELIEAGAAWLLDVREQHEWEAGHAPGAHHIALSELDVRRHELPEGEQILVICRSGGRSRMVTDALLRASCPAVNVSGGMDAWASSGGAVTRPDGSPGTVV